MLPKLQQTLYRNPVFTDVPGHGAMKDRETTSVFTGVFSLCYPNHKKKLLPFIIVIVAGIAVTLFVSDPTVEPSAVDTTSTEIDTELEVIETTTSRSLSDQINTALNNAIPDAPPSYFVLDAVPYLPEAPGGIWEGPWKNGCEEASIAMVEFYYTDKPNVTIDQAKVFMQRLFDTEDDLWGQNANSDATQTTQLINEYTSFTAEIIEQPTINEIKAELLAGRPVIAPLNGFILDNPQIPFLATGSGYHMLVIVGYDDITGHFITHDDGDLVTGENHRYKYQHFMDSIADYNDANKKTDGPMRVLFTSPKN